MDLYTLIGLAGVAGYVTAYTLLQLGFLDGNAVPYSIANVIAASCVLISLFQDFNLASAITQVVWIVVGVTGLLLRLMQRRPTVHEAGVASVEPHFAAVIRLDAVSTARKRLNAERSPFRAAPPVAERQPPSRLAQG